MRILLVGNYLPDEQRSMLRFEDELRRGLADRGVEVDVVRPAQVVGGRRRLSSKWLKYVDQYVIGPLLVSWKARRADVVHIVDHSNSVYRWFIRRPCLVTCHDLLAVRSARGEFDRTPVGRFGRLQQSGVAKSLRTADHIVCVSAATRDDVLSVLAYDKDATSVVPICLAESFGSAAARDEPAGKLPARMPFWIHVGSDAWYKNRAEVVEIFAELREAYDTASLLFVGPPLSDAQRAVADERGVAQWITTVEGITDGELDELYARSLGLIFPSVAEGFGWPVIEAQAAGCPVFASDIGTLNEVGGDGFVALRLGEPATSARLILDGLRWRDALVAQGRANASRFSHALMIDAYLDVYARVRPWSETALRTMPRHEVTSNPNTGQLNSLDRVGGHDVGLGP
jgi:glycosyltransferase involved in cell wall biosynthesis